PVAFAPQRPVYVVLQPVAEAPVLDVVGDPVDLLVERDKLVLLLRRADVPRRAGVVEQGRVTAPAERVRVVIHAVPELQSSRGKLLYDLRVGGLDPPDRPGLDLLDELALRV